jgi:hypothetical protein
MHPPRPTEARDIGAAVSESRSWVGAGCSVDSWRLVAERGVSPAVVVVRLPVADHNSGLRTRPEHVDAQAFVAQVAVERLDVAVAPGLAGAGRGRRLHSPVQRPERRPAALAPLPLYVPYCLRGRHCGAARRDALAIRALRWNPIRREIGPAKCGRKNVNRAAQTRLRVRYGDWGDFLTRSILPATGGAVL